MIFIVMLKIKPKENNFVACYGGGEFCRKKKLEQDYRVGIPIDILNSFPF
jgi:hypothetical protein